MVDFSIASICSRSVVTGFVRVLVFFCKQSMIELCCCQYKEKYYRESSCSCAGCKKGGGLGPGPVVAGDRAHPCCRLCSSIIPAAEPHPALVRFSF